MRVCSCDEIVDQKNHPACGDCSAKNFALCKHCDERTDSDTGYCAACTKQLVCDGDGSVECDGLGTEDFRLTDETGLLRVCVDCLKTWTSRQKRLADLEVT